MPFKRWSVGRSNISCKLSTRLETSWAIPFSGPLFLDAPLKMFEGRLASIFQRILAIAKKSVKVKITIHDVYTMANAKLCRIRSIIICHTKLLGSELNHSKNKRELWFPLVNCILPRHFIHVMAENASSPRAHVIAGRRQQCIIDFLRNWDPSAQTQPRSNEENRYTESNGPSATLK